MIKVITRAAVAVVLLISGCTTTGAGSPKGGAAPGERDGAASSYIIETPRTFETSVEIAKFVGIGRILTIGSTPVGRGRSTHQAITVDYSEILKGDRPPPGAELAIPESRYGRDAWLPTDAVGDTMFVAALIEDLRSYVVLADATYRLIEDSKLAVRLTSPVAPYLGYGFRHVEMVEAVKRGKRLADIDAVALSELRKRTTTPTSNPREELGFEVNSMPEIGEAPVEDEVFDEYNEDP